MQPNTQEQDSLFDDIVEDTMYYRTFFGREADYYGERRLRMQAGATTVFNPFAFFLGFFWMAYRKMYVELLVLAAITIAIESLLSFALEIDNSGQERALNMLWAIAIGFCANIFYFKKATRTINQAKGMYVNTGDQLDYVEKQGGTSVISVVIVGIVLLIIVLGSIFLEEYLNGYEY